MCSDNPYTRCNLELRAAEYYVRLRKPENEWQSIEDLAPQLVEIEHRIEAGDFDNAADVLKFIDFHYLYRWGSYAQLLRSRQQLHEKLSNPDLHVYNLVGMARSCYMLGRVEEAIGYYESALSLARRIGNRAVEGFAVTGLGLVYHVLGDIERATGFLMSALSISEERGDQYEQSAQLGYLGLTHLSIGQFEQAIQFFNRGLTISQSIADLWEESCERGYLGTVYCAIGQYQRALQCYEQALTLARKTADRRGIGEHLDGLGFVYCALGQLEQAAACFEKSVEIAEEIGNQRTHGHSQLGLGTVALAGGAFTLAQQHYEAALAANVPRINYQAALKLGIVLLHLHSSQAASAFGSAIGYCRTILAQMPNLYEPRYVLATALIGQAVCDSRWINLTSELLAPAISEYRRALTITGAPGVIQDALRDLKLIRAAGVEGLETAFELLEGALDE